MVSRVLAATPPSVPEDGEGRMKAFGSLASRAMRVLSARIDPPVRREDGSTASTATLRAFVVNMLPSALISVDLPTPGAPVMPTRTALPVSGKSACINAAAEPRWSARLLSIKVMARESTMRSPPRSPRAMRSVSDEGVGVWSAGVTTSPYRLLAARHQRAQCPAATNIAETRSMEQTRYKVPPHRGRPVRRITKYEPIHATSCGHVQSLPNKEVRTAFERATG